MLHARFRGNRPVGSGEDFLKGFYYIWAWRPSWSCDSDREQLLSALLNEAPLKIWL